MSVDRLLAVFYQRGYPAASHIEQERFYELMDELLVAPGTIAEITIRSRGGKRALGRG